MNLLPAIAGIIVVFGIAALFLWSKDKSKTPYIVIALILLVIASKFFMPAAGKFLIIAAGILLLISLISSKKR